MRSLRHTLSWDHTSVDDDDAVGDGGDVDFNVKAGGSNTLFAQGSSQNIGIRTATPTEKLEIVAGGRIRLTPGTSPTGSIVV